jgi:hypothetical protein
MRLSEQYSLTWGQVHLDRRTIDLTKTKNGSARTVHLNADSIAALESIRSKGQKTSDPVFPREGSRFDTRSWFSPCLSDASIEGYVWHSNRHTFCSWLAMAGATIKEIQELAGHRTITMSARYSHLSSEHRLSVIDRIAAAPSAETNRTKKLKPTATKTTTKQQWPLGRSGHFTYKYFIILVPGGGVEPPRGCPRRILSPLRLPVPPSRHIDRLTLVTP